MFLELSALQLGALTGFMGFIILVVVITLIIGAFFLWISLGLVGVPDKKREFGSVIITQLLNAIIGSFCCILSWYFIKIRHDTSWGQAIAAWFLAGLIPLLIAFGIFYAIGGSLALFGGMPI